MMGESSTQIFQDQNVTEFEAYQTIKNSLSQIISFSKLECLDDNLAKSFVNLIETHWRELIPIIYRPRSAKINSTFNESIGFDELILPLEWFITGSDQPKSLFTKLKEISKPPQLCGKVFRPGEPNYSCRDCSYDSTCVLCVDCFKNSVHRRHRYKICHSSFGYCDCGDSEAWKCDPICSLHSQDPSIIQNVNTILSQCFGENQFERILERLRIVFSFVLDYIYTVIGWLESSMPKRLDREHRNQSFVSVLYNDETHTYDHVISALLKSINCDSKLATDYATTVDREGRCIIYLGTKENCEKINSHIHDVNRRNSERILSVKVFSVDVIAHQTFCTRLLNWIMQLLPVCSQFRSILAEFLYGNCDRLRYFTQSNDDFANLSLIERIMKSDTSYWKSIRVIWHHLFMSGLMLDMEPKKQFAKIFTRHYYRLLKDFVHDDHEHRFSVLALAVQIYTVPSIATMLIEEKNALAVILDAFLELNFDYHSSGKFKFETLSNTTLFKRSYAALTDLQYLLTKTGETIVWTEQLRNNFINGVESFMKLLKRMQNMDSLVRQISQHIEYEPGWDLGMNFEIRICAIIKLLIEWTVTDSKVFCNVLSIGHRLMKDSFDYYATGALKHNQNPLTNTFCTTTRKHCADRSALVFDYNVSRREVSIHIPLVRFISALTLYLPKHNLWNELKVGESNDAVNESKLINNVLNMECLMELPLRVQVLLGQYRAGMWRRNGYSLINQIIFYQNPRLRETTYDLDILALQIGAAALEPNEFMIHVMCKYNVEKILFDQQDSSATIPNEDSIKHQITLLEEFLRLIYTILVERYVVGLGNVNLEDCCKNEIIQWLCKESMSNSDLLSHLSYDDSQLNVEDLIANVADFKSSNSFSNTAGRYILKENFYNKFNPFYYHYSRQDQSAAMENQTKRRRDAKMKFHCCPPPPLPDFVTEFESINRILLCDVTLNIIKSVLEKTIDLKNAFFSDFQFQLCLYLIGIGLNEQLKRPKSFDFSNRAENFGILSLLDQCSSRHVITRIETYQNLYEWCLDRLKQARSSSSLDSKSMENCSEDAVNSDNQSIKNDDEMNRRRQMAAARKQKILQQMQRQQKTFMEENEEYFKTNEIDRSSNREESLQEHSKNNLIIEQEQNQSSSPGIAFGSKRSLCEDESINRIYTCILCLESQDVDCDNNGRFILLAGFLQRSTVLSQNRTIQSWNDKSNILCPRSDHNYGFFINTCTHHMHNDCFEKYIDTTLANERRRSNHRYQRSTFDLKQEFLCPLCECLSNITIPVMPKLKKPIEPSKLQASISMDHWLNAMLAISQDCNRIWIDKFDSIVNVGNFIKSFPELIQYVGEDSRDNLNQIKIEYIAHQQPSLDSSEQSRKIRASLFSNLMEAFKKILKNNDSPSKGDPHETIYCIYWTISFTIQVMERSMRLETKSLSDLKENRHYQCLKSLISLVRNQTYFLPSIFARRIFMYLINYLLVGTVYQSSPYSILEVDAFTLLIALLATAPSFFEDQFDDQNMIKTSREDFSAAKNLNNFKIPLGNCFDKNLMELIIVYHLVQIILTANITDSNDDSKTASTVPMDIDSQEDVSEDYSTTSTYIAAFCKDILIAAGHSFSEEELFSKASNILLKLKQSLLPFLRSIALWAFFLTGCQWPEKLWKQDTNKIDDVEEDYDLLCRYLAIENNMATLLQSINLKHLCLSWTRHPKLSTLFSPTGKSSSSRTLLKSSYSFLKQPHPLNRLIDLPDDFSDLINSVANFTCPNSNGEESRSPTMCLVCGAILCSQNYCCQRQVSKEFVGACNYHSRQCSASVGIFLRIRDNKILLLASRGRGKVVSLGCYLPSPYVDKYGETDSGLFRGHPMFLSSSAYEQLRQLWFRNGIVERIVHRMESSKSLATTNWIVM
ncbi:hypothetical protein NH340_JMT01153 [Sarcoptes scabiei]|nr:hypothetical protein NH340_JMT01153 [Sarcoptes scabiei]